MASFVWDQYFETGLDTVDQQHRVLVDLINRFGEQLTQGSAVNLADSEVLFQELENYARYHFRDEEEMLARVGLDPRHIRQHQDLHADFLTEVVQMHDSNTNDGTAASRLLKFLTYWLAYHILGTDQSMARQIAAMQAGHSAAQAYEADLAMKDGATEPLLVALNGLFQEMSERNRELKELNRTLEARVAERTQSLSQANELLQQMSMTDVLTGLPNRRQAMARLAMDWNAAVQADTALACMMIDADGFKQINDQYGHDAGDEVLRTLARQLRHAVRTDDIVCRLGGDEFFIICPRTTLPGALHAAELVRQEVAALRVPVAGGGNWQGSVSIGVAQRQAGMRNLEDLMKAADEGMYQAKRAGRNRVATAVP